MKQSDEKSHSIAESYEKSRSSMKSKGISRQSKGGKTGSSIGMGLHRTRTIMPTSGLGG